MTFRIRRARPPLALKNLAAIAALLLLALGVFACATTPDPEPIAVSKIQPGPNDRVVDHVLVLVDTSGSINEEDQFPQTRSLVRSFVSAMPDGSYEVSFITFGGVDRQVYEASPFDRDQLGAYAVEIDHLDDGTPLRSS